MTNKTLAQRVREAAQRLGQFSANELADETQVQTYKERATVVKDYIRDFVRRGEMERVERGLYRYIKLKKRRTQLDIIWHLIRSHRHFSTDEMERLSGAVRNTVLEYLRCLVRLGYLKKTGRKHWKLMNDPGPETPTNTGKCKRLREIRRRRRTEGRGQKTEDRRRRTEDGGQKEDRGQRTEDRGRKVKIELPPLSEEGLVAALGMAPLERIEQIRRA